MSKRTFFDTVRVIIVIAILITLGVAAFTKMNRGFQEEREVYCADLGKRLGYETELISNHCYLKVRPGLKIRQDQVLDFLPVIDCR